MGPMVSMYRPYSLPLQASRHPLVSLTASFYKPYGSVYIDYGFLQPRGFHGLLPRASRPSRPLQASVVTELTASGLIASMGHALTGLAVQDIRL